MSSGFASFGLVIALTSLIVGCGGQDAVRINAVEAFKPQANVISIDTLFDRPSKGPAPIDIGKLSLGYTASQGWSIAALRKDLQYAIKLVNQYNYSDLVAGFRRLNWHPWYRSESPGKTINWLLQKYDERMQNEVGLSAKEAYAFRRQYGKGYRSARETGDAIQMVGRKTTLGNLKWLHRIKNGRIPVGEVQVRLTALVSGPFQPPFVFSDQWAHPDWYRDLFAGAVAYTILTRAAEDAVGLPRSAMAMVPSLDGRQDIMRNMNLELRGPMDNPDMDFETYFGEWSPAGASASQRGGYVRIRGNTLNPNRMCSILIHADKAETLKNFGIKSAINWPLALPLKLGSFGDNLLKSIGDAMFNDVSKWMYDLVLLPSDQRALEALREAASTDASCAELLVSRITRKGSTVDDDVYIAKTIMEKRYVDQGIVKFREITPEQYESAQGYASSILDYAIHMRTGGRE